MAESQDEELKRFEADYHAPDREAVLAKKRGAISSQPQIQYGSGGGATGNAVGATFGGGPSFPQKGSGGFVAGTVRGGYQTQGAPAPAPENEAQKLARFEADYHAPDREAVLAKMRGAPQAQPAPSGQAFDAESFRKGWTSSGGRTPQDLANFIKQHPGAAGAIKVVGSKGDKIQLPDGRVIDAVFAAGLGGQGAQWLDESAGGGSRMAGLAGGGGGGALGPMGGPGGAAGGARDPRFQALYDQLLKRSGQSLTEGAESPAVKAQLEASSVAANRERTQQLQQAAERSGPYATGEISNAARASGERVQMGQSQMAAQLVGREIDSRRQEIQQALAQMGSQLSVEEQSRLRQEDQALAQRQLEVQRELGLGGLGVQQGQLGLTQRQLEDVERQRRFDRLRGLAYTDGS